MKGRILFAVFITAAFVGCGGGSERSESSTVVEAPKTARKAAATEIDACTVLTRELIAEHFEIGPAELDLKSSTMSRNAFCKATWRKADADEIEKEMKTKLPEYMMAKARGEDVKMPSFRTDNDVSLTINMPPAESVEAAASAFQFAMRRLEEGFKDKDDPDAPPKFQYETEPVTGVGEQASWTPGLSQLSVQSGRYLFHVTVIAGDAEMNQSQAKALAAGIAEALGR